MNGSRRFIVLLTLFAGLASLSFGETLYSFTTGLYRFSEYYPKESYGRDFNGINANFILNYYLPESSFGFFLQTSLGGISSGYEWKDDELTTLDVYSIEDIRIGLGPSYKLQLGEKISLPISAGPVFSIFREESYDYWYSNSGFYEAFNIGILADFSIVFIPGKWFFIKNGLMLSCDFLRFEKGMMQTNSREVSNVQFKHVPYFAYTGVLYFGIGVRFE